MRKKQEEMSTSDQFPEANVVLHEYFQGRIGRQKAIAEASGIFASALSSMAHGRVPITLGAAILIDVASEGAVKAEALCPAHAEALGKFLKMRMGQPEVTA